MLTLLADRARVLLRARGGGLLLLCSPICRASATDTSCAFAEKAAAAGAVASKAIASE